MEFQIAYYVVVVRHFSHYEIGTLRAMFEDR